MICPTCHHHHEDTPNHHPDYLQDRIRELEQERERLDEDRAWLAEKCDQIGLLQAQLQAVTQKRDQWKEAATAAVNDLCRERPAFGRLQAHNKAMRDALKEAKPILEAQWLANGIHKKPRLLFLIDAALTLTQEKPAG